MVILRDGRKLIGILRSFDQFGKGSLNEWQPAFVDSLPRLSDRAALYAANVVIEAAVERVIVGSKYCDLPLGLYIIRGENVVLIGALVRPLFSPLCAQPVPCQLWEEVGGGEQDGDMKDMPPHMVLVSMPEIRQVRWQWMG